MFASNEDRVLQVHVAEGARCLSHGAVWPDHLVLAQQRLANFPTKAGLRRLGEELASGDWCFYFDAPEREVLQMRPRPAAAHLTTYMAFPASFDSVQVEAWRLRFHAAGEDRNANGRLDPGEDVIANGYVDAPLVVPERILRWSSTARAEPR
jgi:hypothetical protein